MAQGRAIVVAQAGAGLASLALPFLLARHMALADYAAFVTVLSAGSFLAVVAGLGMDRALYRLVPPLVQSGRAGAVWSVVARAAALRGAALMMLLAMLAVVRPWLGLAQHGPLDSLGLWVAALALALGSSELASAALQSALRPLPLARATAVVSFGRLCVIGVLVAATGRLSLEASLWLLLGGEAVLALWCLAGLASALAAAPRVGPLREVPATAELLRAGLANHGAYLLGLVWAGSTLRLLVAATSPVATTAAFGFFQLLAERGRMYLPVAFMQRQVEPQWAADFDQRARVQRFNAVGGALGKLQFHALAMLGVTMVAAGPWLLAAVVRPDYAQHEALVLLMIVQQVVGGYAVLMWMGANASRRNALLTQAMLLATLLGAPLLWLTARFIGAEGVVLVTMLPPLVVVGFASLRGDRALVRAMVRPIAALQLAWAVVCLGVAWVLSHAVPAPLAAVVVPALYVAGVFALARVRRAGMLTRSERWVVAQYLARQRE